MKYSLDWLKEHLDGELPSLDTLVREVTMRAFEVEEVEPHEGDTTLEIKVLPDRAHDALSHRGMAREIGALLGVPRKSREIDPVTVDPSVAKVKITIEDPKLCPRYIAVRIDGIAIAPSPEALAKRFVTISSRSINNIVDITNFVLFDIGQPLHAFDAKKVVGGITVRLAKPGETMTTLDERTFTLSGKELVIADDEGVLALAGIKGGKKAEVTKDTKSIILECANFDPTLTRKTSQLLNLKTDASKRYENGITSAFAKEGCDLALSLIAKYGGSPRFSQTSDVYPHPEEEVTVSVTKEEVGRLLGLSVSDEEVSAVLERAGHRFARDEKRLVVTAPQERLDLRIKEDLIEEIGRHIGYEKIASVVPNVARKGLPTKRLYYMNRVREYLAKEGMSEVYTYSFATKESGVREVLLPVGKDRPYVRDRLSSGLFQSLLANTYNAPLIGIDDVRIFELGNVFPLSGEHMTLGVALSSTDKKRAKELATEFARIADGLFDMLGAKGEFTMTDFAPTGVVKYAPIVAEIDFDALIAKLPEPTEYEPFSDREREKRYRSLSAYPFIVRDIAIFVPESVKESYIEELLKKEAGELVVRCSQFDKFQKSGESRVSYAYRMVFQSFERTLTDDEVGKIMERVTARCNAEKDWEVR